MMNNRLSKVMSMMIAAAMVFQITVSGTQMVYADEAEETKAQVVETEEHEGAPVNENQSIRLAEAETPQTIAATDDAQTETTEANQTKDTETIEGMEAPLAGENGTDTETGKSWALVNLILSIIAAVMALIAAKRNAGRKLITRVITLVPAAIAVILFLLTEDMMTYMTMIDEWSFLTVVLFAVQAVIAIASHKADDEEQENA